VDIKKKINAALEYLRAGNVREAERIFRNILKIQPNNVSALHFTGVICYKRKEYAPAITYIKKALQFGPDYADAYNNLGSVLQEIGQLDEAIACYLKALDLNPHFDRAHYNLGAAFKEKWRFADAIAQYQEAIRVNPYLFEAYNNLGLALQDQGKLEDAEEYYRCALRIKPDFALCYSNLLLLMNYNSRHDAQAVFSEHLRFSNQVAEPLYPVNSHHTNDRSPSRRLKIGYVSPDFRRHSVNYFIEPVLASHSHEQFEVYCYSDVLRPDQVTERLQGYADQWRDIAGMPDEQVGELIRKDGIDILIDLAGHTGYNRMLLFARKPAPIQVSWLGYPNTTGLKTMDYRLVDAYTDPPGLTDPYYTEKLVRLPESFLCYQPDTDSPAVGSLPALKTGYITFGSFNIFPKVSQETFALWARVLKVLPASRLIIKARSFSDGVACNHAMEMFTAHGISPERVELIAHMPSFAEHLDLYNRIDIAMDTFPYHGTTTTCEALWMGVPVITLSGSMHASRVGTSLLSNIGLPQLIAKTHDEYSGIALHLARDIERLRLMREGLRKMIKNSPLIAAKWFTVNLENCYHKMWMDWYKSI
jgi:protein O-GlcNAc transferase